MNGSFSSISCVFLTVLTITVSTAAQNVEIQTDWSGGPGEPGPVEQWGNRFLSADDVAWRSIAGQLALSGTPLAQPVEHIIAPDADHPRSCAVGDFDGDGDMDVVTCTPIHDYPHGWIYWWERQPDDTWGRHVVTDDFYGGYYVDVVDFDHDGDTDVLAAAYYGDEDYSPYNNRNGRYAWFENLNGDGSAWTQHLAGEMFWGARYADAGDLDGDGDIDIVGAAELTDGVWEQDGDVTWLENLDGTGTQWEQHELEWDRNSAEAHVADLDGDGDLDVVSGEQGRIGWWENRNGDGSLWLKRYVTTDFADSTMHLDVGDIDNDGDLDVFGAAYHFSEIVWWENTAGNGSVWFGHLVASGRYTHVIRLRDIDGDGDLDAALSLGLTGGSAYWLENVSGDGIVWSARLITYSIEGGNYLALGDVNDDGRLGAVITDEDTARQNIRQVAWHDLTRFNAEGELISSVLDGGAAPSWGAMTWDADVATDTDLIVQVRASNDPLELGPFASVGHSGDDLGDLIDPHAQYLQYRLLLSTEDSNVSPVVREINVEGAIPGDLNGDGCVDQADLGILLAAFGVDDGGDLDGDGDTDQSDLGILLANWGDGCA